MVVKIINGMRIHEPPYAQAEEDEFYRRVGRGPAMVTVQSRRPQSSSRRRQNRATLKALLKSIAIQPGPWPIILRAFWTPLRATWSLAHSRFLKIGNHLRNLMQSCFFLVQ
jgi:hypothetical protein